MDGIGWQWMAMVGNGRQLVLAKLSDPERYIKPFVAPVGNSVCFHSKGTTSHEVIEPTLDM
jgi:hypothetical protein